MDIGQQLTVVIAVILKKNPKAVSFRVLRVGNDTEAGSAPEGELSTGRYEQVLQRPPIGHRGNLTMTIAIANQESASLI